MQAALDKAYHNNGEGLDDAPGIAMLDFMKAYDTLDRDFLYLVLSKFGFGRQFVDLVRRMHSDTTAQYLVNGEVSREWEVKSGIRQGCPLAPLLFIVAAEILALAVQQDPHLEGIRVTRSGAEPHLISTFVDDSAVFLKQGKQLPRLMQLLSEFGQQSGLHVQPTKSSYICLNTAVVQEQRCGIPILKHGETVRYLGIQIAPNQIDHRGQSLQQCGGESASTEFGLAAVDSVHCRLHQALGEGRGSASESTKAIFVEIDTRHRRHEAQGESFPALSASQGRRHRLGWEYLCEDLVAAERRNPAWKDDLKQQMESLLPTLDLEGDQTDVQGEQYTVKTVPFLKECNLASFNVRREGERVFSVGIPTMTATLTFKRMTTLRKLVTSIILCSPEIEIDTGNQLNSHQEPWSRKHTKREYKWISNGMGTITAVPVSEGSHTDYIQMQRQANGVLWTVTDWAGGAICQQDVAMIEEERAQAAWTAFLERWMGRTLTEQALNLFLPHIASRTAPPGQRSLLQELVKHFGFITPEHSTALQKLWFIVTSSIPVLLWRTRMEIVHERQHLTIEESTQRVWTARKDQCNLPEPTAQRTGETRFVALTGRMGDGPGGSGWALIFLNERSNRWELKACGYAYMGPEVTNNWCEYSALKDGLAYSAHYLQHYENEFDSIRQTKLQPLAVRVNQIIANFAWISWNHTKREQNKMADLLANMAMNSKNAKILTDESRGNDQVLMSQVAALLDNDIDRISFIYLLTIPCGNRGAQSTHLLSLRKPLQHAQTAVFSRDVRTPAPNHLQVSSSDPTHQQAVKLCVRPRTTAATCASGGTSGSSSTFFHNGARRSRQRASQEFSRLFKQHKKLATLPTMCIPEEAVYAHPDMTV
ncbi:Rxlr effector protein, partial [Globisporangium splendens]